MARTTEPGKLKQLEGVIVSDALDVALIVASNTSNYAASLAGSANAAVKSVLQKGGGR